MKKKKKKSHGRNITGLQSVVTSYLGLFLKIIFLNYVYHGPHKWSLKRGQNNGRTNVGTAKVAAAAI